MVLTYVISKSVISNATFDEIVCPALILAANSTDDLHVQNNIVTVNNSESSLIYILQPRFNFVSKLYFNKKNYDCCSLKDMGSEMCVLKKSSHYLVFHVASIKIISKLICF